VNREDKKSALLYPSTYEEIGHSKIASQPKRNLGEQTLLKDDVTAFFKF
jgi:hypothetical protein